MDELVHGAPADTTAPLRSPVMAWNEWDPLEEVIVGRARRRHHPVQPRHGDLQPAAGRGAALRPRRRLEISALDGASSRRRSSTASSPSWKGRGSPSAGPTRSISRKTLQDAELALARLLHRLPARRLPGGRRRDHRDADVLALALFRGRRLPLAVQGILFVAARAGLRRRARSSPMSCSITISACPSPASRCATRSTSSSRSSTPPISCAAAATCS